MDEEPLEDAAGGGGGDEDEDEDESENKERDMIHWIEASEYLTKEIDEQNSSHSLKVKLSRFVLVKACAFLDVDLFVEPSGQMRLADLTIGHCLKRLTRVELLKKLMRPKMVLFLMAFIYLATSLSLQYMHDAQLVKLDHLKSLLARNKAQRHGHGHGDKHTNMMTNNKSTPDAYLKLSSLIERQEGRLEVARQALELIGAPFINTNFCMEILHLHMLTMGWIVYLSTFVALNVGLQYRAPFASVVVDASRENRLDSQLIAAEFFKFVSSSRNYVRRASDGANTSKRLRQLRSDHRLMVRQLFGMARRGELQQLNWWNGCIHRLGRYYGAYFVLLFISNLLTFLNVNLMLWRAVGQEPRTGLRDHLVNVCALILFLYITVGVVYFNAFVLFQSLANTGQVNSLVRIIDNIIRRNRNELVHLTGLLNAGPGARLLESTSASQLVQSIRARMNKRLLFALAHFKLFVTQWEQIRETLQLVVMSTILLLFLMPAEVSLHVSYMSLAELKQMGIVWSLVTVVMLNLVVAPTCHFHLRSLQLYRRLNSLMAHLIETIEAIQVSQSHYGPWFVYNKHLVWTLAQELRHPDLLASQFAISVGGVHFTYSNLVRIHFWFGVLLLSVVSELEAQREGLFGHLLRDPFGLMVSEMDAYI